MTIGAGGSESGAGVADQEASLSATESIAGSDTGGSDTAGSDTAGSEMGGSEMGGM